MYKSGQIYYIKNFKQSENSLPKNRFVVILSIRKVDYAVIIHKVTSEPYCEAKLLKPKGNTVNDKTDIFFFPKNEIIGKNGFNFKMDSYIHMGVWNISDFSLEKFQSFDSNYCDELIDEWINDLLYFIYKSEHIKQKYVSLLEEELDKLN